MEDESESQQDTSDSIWDEHNSDVQNIYYRVDIQLTVFLS